MLLIALLNYVFIRAWIEATKEIADIPVYEEYSSSFVLQSTAAANDLIRKRDLRSSWIAVREVQYEHV